MELVIRWNYTTRITMKASNGTKLIIALILIKLYSKTRNNRLTTVNHTAASTLTHSIMSQATKVILTMNRCLIIRITLDTKALVRLISYLHHHGKVNLFIVKKLIILTKSINRNKVINKWPPSIQISASACRTSNSFSNTKWTHSTTKNRCTSKLNKIKIYIR